MEVYFDNAATTPIDPEVFEAMKPYMTEFYGNPSSIHTFGRKSRSAIEIARKTIADLLNTSPSEVFFTSGGTEADNTALVCSISSGKFKRVISSPLEHHAVLHTLENLASAGSFELTMLEVDNKGRIDHHQLESLLSEGTSSIVSLMEANNEIGNLNDLVAIGRLCAKYNAVLHSDTVQSVGHYQHDLQELSIHCMVGSAHKFHGPKGAGFLYLNANH
ncbi:MAG: cysteine desulfurase family protein, partial [Cyclobacteriaceae bacterium]